MKDFLCLPKDAIPLHCQRDVVQLSYLFTCLGIFSLHLWEVLSCCRNDRTSTHQRTDVFVMIKYSAHRKLKDFSKVRILVTASFGEEDVAYVWAVYSDNSHKDWHCTEFLELDVTLYQRSFNTDLNLRVARKSWRNGNIIYRRWNTRMNNIYTLRFLTFS